MNHVIAFLIKFISIYVLLAFIQAFLFNMPVFNVLIISLLLSVLLYVVGDLLILPRTNNVVATILDFVLAMTIIWISSGALTYGTNIDIFTMSLISSAGITFFESFFNKYFVIYVIYRNDKNEVQDIFMQYHTEAAEEYYPSELIRDDEKKNEE